MHGDAREALSEETESKRIGGTYGITGQTPTLQTQQKALQYLTWRVFQKLARSKSARQYSA
jgi:hypothetical protein